ncbi:hypothetical protein CUN38_04900 [Enterococcus faecium]|nr:hypothetical protein CUN38_04900 [Enterococcus faecium]
MSYTKSILRAFRANKNVLYKLVLVLTIVFSLTYLPHLMLVYMIRTLCIGFIVMTLLTLVDIGIKDAQFRKKKHINR